MLRKYGETPFPTACAKGYLEDVQLMVEHVTTLDINESKSKDGKTGAYLAAFHGKEDVVKYLLGKGANEQDVREWENSVEAKMSRKYGEKPFPTACAKGNLEDVQLMVEHVPTLDINESKSKEGKTGLYLAMFHGHEDMVKYLIGKGAIKGDAVEGNNLDGSALLAW